MRQPVLANMDPHCNDCEQFLQDVCDGRDAAEPGRCECFEYPEVFTSSTPAEAADAKRGRPAPPRAGLREDPAEDGGRVLTGSVGEPAGPYTDRPGAAGVPPRAGAPAGSISSGVNHRDPW